MPSLLMFALAEHAIIDQITDRVSMIGLFEALTVSRTDTSPDEPSEMIRTSWFVFVSWLMEPDEVDIPFEQRLRLVSPSGIITEGPTTRFIATYPLSRVLTRVPAVVVEEPGIHFFELDLRQKRDEEAKWVRIGRHPLVIRHENEERTTDDRDPDP